MLSSSVFFRSISWSSNSWSSESDFSIVLRNLNVAKVVIVATSRI